MYKYFFTFLVLAYAHSGFTQQKFFELQNSLKQGNRSIKESFAVTSEKENTLAIFLDDNKTLNGYLYTEELKPISKCVSEGLPNRYDRIIGQTQKDQSIQLFLKDKRNKKFGSVLFDFKAGTTTEKEFDFKLRKEQYLQSYSMNDTFYLATVTKRSSIINLYIFDHNGSFKKEEINLAHVGFKNSLDKEATLYELVTKQQPLSATVDLSKIDSATPNSVDVTSNYTKFYEDKNGFTMTMDESDLYTYVVSCKLPEISITTNVFKKPSLTKDVNPGFKKTNSFLTDKHLFQIISSNQEMVTVIKNRMTKEELKRFSVAKQEDISFKNTPIIQEGGAYIADRVREMEKTSKFLRKISGGNVGLAVLPIETGYQITMGGYQELKGGGGAPMMMAGGFGGVPIGSAGAITVSFNPVFAAYNSYSGSKSTRIESLVNKDFEHISGEIEDNVFDKIREFSDKIQHKKAENVFRFQDRYIYGYYNNKLDQFITYQFE